MYVSLLPLLSTSFFSKWSSTVMKRVSIALVISTISVALLLTILIAKRAAGAHEVVIYYKMGSPHCIKFDRVYGIASIDVELSRRFEFKETIDLRLAKYDDIRPQIAKMCKSYPCYVVSRNAEIVKVGSGPTSLDEFKAWLQWATNNKENNVK